MQIALPGGLLRRHVRGRAQHVTVLREPRAGGAGRSAIALERSAAVAALARGRLVEEPPAEAPVHHEHVAELADHHVVGLEIAVDDPAAVRVRDGLADARERVDEAAEGPARSRLVEARAGGGRVHLLDRLAERAASDLAHGEPEAAVVEPAPVVDSDDARVREAGGELHLGLEASQAARPRGDVGVEDLHRDRAIERGVEDAPDLTEAAPARRPRSR